MSYNALLICSSLTSIAYLGITYIGTAALTMPLPGQPPAVESTNTLPIYLAAPTLALLHHLLVLLVPVPSLSNNIKRIRGEKWLPAYATSTLNILLLALLSVFCTASGMTTLVVAAVDLFTPPPSNARMTTMRDAEDEMIRGRLHAFQAVMALCQGALLALMFAHALLGAKREARDELERLGDVEALLEEDDEEKEDEEDEEL